MTSWSTPHLSTTKLGELICKQGVHLSPRDLTTRFGIYEAQLSGRIYKKSQDKTFADSFVAKQAKVNAEEAEHQSFAWGRCPNGDAWSISAPAPDISLTLKANTLSYNYKTASQACHHLDVKFAPALSSEIQTIQPEFSSDKSKATIAVKDLKDGMLSLTCTSGPKNPKAGNVLWFLVPVGSLSDAPLADKPDANNTRTGLTAWVQRIRTQYKRSALKQSSPKAAEAAMRLSQTQIISHDTIKLKRETEELAKQKIELIGENRVIGSTLQDMQWLLWYSPAHRSLLLNSSADQMAVYVERINGSEELAVVIFAKTRS